MGRPGLQQGATRRELLVTEQRLDLWSLHQLLQETAHHLLVDQPVAFLVNVVGCQIGSSGLRPTNQQNSRL